MVKRYTVTTAACGGSPQRPRLRSKKRPVTSPTKRRQLKRLTPKNRDVLDTADAKHSDDARVCAHEPDTVQNDLRHAEVYTGLESELARGAEPHHRDVGTPSLCESISTRDVMIAGEGNPHLTRTSAFLRDTATTEGGSPGSGGVRSPPRQPCPSESTDSGAVDEEYPDPVGSTLQQKEMRRLARLKQVEEFKAREMAESREERFRRRQSGQAFQPIERQSKVKWRGADDLTTIHIYSPVDVVSEELT